MTPTEAGEPDPFRNRDDGAAGGEGLAHALEQLRDVQDLFASTRPPDDTLEAVAARLRDAAALLRPWTAPEADVRLGHRPDLPGRGNPLLPPFVVDGETRDSIHGRVRFTPYFLGGNGAAHGGTLPLFFDDILGRLSNAHGRSRARTAFLHVNYRMITPIGPELRFHAALEREEGRKRFVSGWLRDADDALLADAEGLFVVLLPGQP